MIRVGITIGDINGIGPEIIIKALRDNRILQDCIPIIYGSTKTISHHKKLIHGEELTYQSCKNATEAVAKKVNVVNVWNDEIKFDLGQSTETGGKYAFLSLEKATEDLAANKIDVLVTAPISKDGIIKAGFQFPGHTEYLAHLSNQEEVLMLMVNGNLRVALVTTHLALKEVASTLTKDKIVQKIKMLESSLKKDFGLIRPKIAVFGLNPHAGENGKMGDEEQNIITPAIQQAKSEGILAFGPYPADSFFGSGSVREFDGILAMYHDQGLTAFKALAFEEGVNYTAGLPIVRTSPDHGTAFDIAGQDKASEQSMRSAIYLALDIYRNRQFVKEISTNPLPFSDGDNKKHKVREGQIE
ncbi:MAG: pdxA [Crocinitomicaceae bacterium]|jgi:4-hydroxythreonine-4-phosphate dehydrogenase|nr:pdxA [Crocinitomicaceae bacterium]